MKNKLVLLVLILSLSFNAAFIGALAYHFFLGHPRHGPGPRWAAKGSFPDSDLRLNPQQSEAIDDLRHGLEEATRPIRKQMYTNRQELFELLQAKSLDSNAISARIDEINALQRRMQATVVDYMIKEREILDEEQRRVFFERMRGRMCPGGGPGGMGPLFGRCHNEHGPGRHAR